MHENTTDRIFTATFDDDEKKLIGQPGSVWTIAATLKQFVNKTTGKCWPSIRTIHKACGLAISTVKKALRILKEIGYIIVHRREGTTNIYEMNLATKTGNRKQRPKATPEPVVASQPGENVPHAPVEPTNTTTPTHTAPAPQTTATEPPKRKRPKVDPKVTRQQAEAYHNGFMAEYPELNTPAPYGMRREEAQIMASVYVAGMIEAIGEPTHVTRHVADLRMGGGVYSGDLRSANTNQRIAEGVLNPERDWQTVVRSTLHHRYPELSPYLVAYYINLITPLVATGEVCLADLDWALGTMQKRGPFYADHSATSLARAVVARRMEFPNLKDKRRESSRESALIIEDKSVIVRPGQVAPAALRIKEQLDNQQEVATA